MSVELFAEVTAVFRTLSKETQYTEEMVETSTGRLMVAYSGKPRCGIYLTLHSAHAVHAAHTAHAALARRTVV